MKKPLSYLYIFMCLLGFLAMNNASHGMIPEDLSRNEVQLWKAYYSQDPAEIGAALPKFIQCQYGVEDAKGLVPLYMQTLMAFSQVPQSALQETYEREVLPLLETVFTSLQQRSSLTFDPKKVARAELQWWIARRGTPEEYDPQNVGALMQESYVLLYGGRQGDYETTALQRARAARLRDDYWESSSGKGLTDREWTSVEELLSAAYSHFPMERLTSHF